MKARGKGSNCFDNDELARYYNDYENCGWCNMIGADCFDHVISRKEKYTGSIFNALPAHNHKCNINQHGAMHTHNNQVKLILKNMLRLKREGYKPTELDNKFILEHKQAQEALKML